MDDADDSDRERITPAHAGRSQIIKPIHLPVKDHPRACGEKKVHGPKSRS